MSEPRYAARLGADASRQPSRWGQGSPRDVGGDAVRSTMDVSWPSPWTTSSTSTHRQLRVCARSTDPAAFPCGRGPLAGGRAPVPTP